MKNSTTESTNLITTDQDIKDLFLVFGDDLILSEKDFPKKAWQTMSMFLYRHLSRLITKKIEEFVKLAGDMIVIKVPDSHDQSLSLEWLFSGNEQDVNWKVANMVMKPEKSYKAVVFFQPLEGGTNFIPLHFLHEAYEKIGLKPLDLYTLASINKENPEFSNSHVNATFWNCGKDKKAFALFKPGKIDIHNNSSCFLHREGLWLAGVPKDF